MTAIKPTPSSTDTPRRSRARPPLHSSPTLINHQQHLPSSASPSPPISSFSLPPSPSTIPLTLTHPHDTTTTTSTNDNDTTASTSQAPNNTRTRNNINDTHRLPHQATRQGHRTRSSKNNNNHIYTHHHSHHRRNHHHHNSHTNNNNNSSNHSRRTPVRRHSASAYYSGPVDHDKVIHTANAHAQAAASGILSPRLRNSRLLLSPKGSQPQRHSLRQQRQQQQQLRRYQQQQQQLLQPLIFDVSHQIHRQQQHEHVQARQQEQEEQHHHTSRRGSSYSIQLPSISPSSSVSVVSPLVLHRASSMPLVHTRPLERQDQGEAISLALRQSQPLPLQPPFYRLLQQSPQSRRQQQQHQHNQALALESDDQDRPVDEPPPDPRLISQKLLQWQEQQQHRKRQEEQRKMQAFRIKKFSDSNTDLDIWPMAATMTAFKEGFQEHWGDPIVEHLHEELDDVQQHSRRSSIQQDDREVDVAGSNDEHGNNNLWEERRRRQRQQAQEQDMMETDSVMETDKTGEVDGDEVMDSQTRLQRARKAKEDAVKEYQEAGRNLQRAQEREEAILFENEMIEVEVGSSVSQQPHHRQGGHAHGHEQRRQHLSSPLVQLQQRQQRLEERSKHSSPTTVAAAIGAVTSQIQDDNNNDTMMSSQIVPQVNDTPSIISETPHVVMAPAPLLPISTPPRSAPRRALTPMTIITTTTTENQVPNQMRSGNQARSRSQSVTNNEIQPPLSSPQTRHDSNSPRIRIKSEELDEPFFKRHVLGSGSGGVARPNGDSKRWRGPKYKDYDVSIVIPSSVGSSDVGMNGQLESGDAQERREQPIRSERRLPGIRRSPTPMPRSMHAKREATKSHQRGIFWESTRPPLRFGPGAAKVVPVDLFGGRDGYSQQRHQHRQHGSSSSRPALLSPRSSVPRPRPYPPPAISPTRRASQAQTQAPVGGGGLPSILFAGGMPIQPPPPLPSSSSSSSQHQRGQGQGQGRSSPMMAPLANQSTSTASASAFTTAAASAFTGPRPAAPTPRYANPHPHPHPQGQPAWRIPEFMDENGHPYPAVVFYTHIDRVDHFYHQHYPASTASRSRDVSLSPKSARTFPNFFARHSGGERMEDVSGGEGYEDMAMEGESHHHQRQSRSRTTSRQADRDERVGEEDRRERKPRPKSESPLL